VDVERSESLVSWTVARIDVSGNIYLSGEEKGKQLLYSRYINREGRNARICGQVLILKFYSIQVLSARVKWCSNFMLYHE